MRGGLMVESICLRAPVHLLRSSCRTRHHCTDLSAAVMTSLTQMKPVRISTTGRTVMRQHIIAMFWLRVTWPVEAANRCLN